MKNDREKLNTLQKKHFDKEKYRYDIRKLSNPPTHTKLEIEKLINLIPKDAAGIVDFGAGNGRLTIPLLEKGYKVTAVDISKKSLDQLKILSQKYNFRINTRVSLEKIRGSDAVVGCDVLHHVDLSAELKGIYRSLKDGGVVAFSEPNLLNPSWLIYFILKGIWKYEKGIFQCSLYNLAKIFKKNRFGLVAIYGLGLLPRAFFRSTYLCRLNDLLGNFPILKIFAYRFIVFAVK